MSDIPNWHIVGDWFDNCSCAVACPCTFAQAPDNGFCESVLFWRIREGHYGDIKLDNLSFVRVGRWEGDLWARKASGVAGLSKEGDRSLIFEPNEFYYRGCAPEEANAWELSIFAFPVHVVPPVRVRDGQALLDIAIEPVNGRLVSVIQLKVMYLLKAQVFLGTYVSAIRAEYPVKSGWMLRGPGDYSSDREGHVLFGIYPRSIHTVGLRPLDREPMEGMRE